MTPGKVYRCLAFQKIVSKKLICATFLKSLQKKYYESRKIVRFIFYEERILTGRVTAQFKVEIENMP